MCFFCIITYFLSRWSTTGSSSLERGDRLVNGHPSQLIYERPSVLTVYVLVYLLKDMPSRLLKVTNILNFHKFKVKALVLHHILLAAKFFNLFLIVKYVFSNFFFLSYSYHYPSVNTFGVVVVQIKILSSSKTTLRYTKRRKENH